MIQKITKKSRKKYALPAGLTHARHFFRAYTRLAPEGGAETGIDLSMVRDLVELHHGKIQVENIINDKDKPIKLSALLNFYAVSPSAYQKKS